MMSYRMSFPFSLFFSPFSRVVELHMCNGTSVHAFATEQ